MSDIEKDFCHKRVYGDSFVGRRCSKPVWKDGWCKVHHPESVAARHAKAEVRWEEKRKASPYYKLQKALQRIAELEAEVAALKGGCER